MNRRSTIKKLTMASIGLVSLPAWASEWSADQIVLPSLFQDVEQEILAAVTDTIIPAGNTIGALSVETDKFLQRLFADCYEEEVQNNLKKQLLALDQSAQTAHEKSFSLCTQAEREVLLLERSTSEDTDQKDFFDLVKKETIRGFRTSKEVMMKYQDYVMAPGHYYGCVDLNI